jgi:FtsZ-binding cell division protein ZapB
VYNDAWWDKLEFGTCVYGVFWDTDKLNGLGDISIRLVDMLSIYWEPGISDIQDSRNIFVESLVDLDELKKAYPDKEITATSAEDVREYRYNDNIPKTNKVQVVDWYYKKKNDRGKTVLHLIKMCQGAVLFSTEKSEQFAETGLYDHGLYPFIVDRIYPEKGTIAGFGPVDIMKSPQEYIDKLNQAMLKNAMVNARPRYFVRDDAAISSEEFADIDKDFVTVHGNLDDSGVKPIVQTQLPPIYMNLLQLKIEELKETSGNWDVSNGGTTSGATAASAIAALQEASGKGSRDMNKSAYRACAKIYSMCIELIRQFYDEPRTFRITGEDGSYKFENFSNEGLKDIITGNVDGQDLYRKPIFDIKVQAQKASVYSTLSQNELAKEFFSAGFFNPQISDQALACVEMMQFEGKEKVIKKIGENGTLLQQVQQLQQQLLSLSQVVEMLRPGTGVADSVAGQILGSNEAQPTGRTNIDLSRGSLADQARARSQSVATPT